MIRNRLWRVVALASTVGMVGAACGGDDSGDSPTTSAGATSAVATSAVQASTTTAAAPATTVGDSSTSTTAATPTTAALPSTVTVEQRFGPTELPVAPERIVASSGPWLDALLAFGVQPVAYIGNNRGDDGLDVWERDVIDDAELIRTENPNFTFPLELVTAAEPDLILMNPYVGADQTQFDLANQIAPTLSRLGTGE